MDWMCEPFVIDKTGLSVREHQERTVQSYLDLRHRGPFVPVLQGWDMDDYWRCVDLYTEAGVDLRTVPVVGIGSVCRRQGTSEAERLIVELAALGIRLHGFGFKRNGLDRVAWALHSSDSLAWSYNARRNPPMIGCTHKNCNSCIRWALRWRADLLSKLDRPQQAALAFGRSA
jgi:hypothetical protein